MVQIIEILKTINQWKMVSKDKKKEANLGLEGRGRRVKGRSEGEKAGRVARACTTPAK